MRLNGGEWKDKCVNFEIYTGKGMREIMIIGENILKKEKRC